VQAGVTLERPSTIAGQTDVDRGSDGHGTSRQEQYHHMDATPDTAAARWTDRTASTSTDLQLHDSTVDEEGGESATDGKTNVDRGNVERDTSRQ
jgi:hypothetical protein